MDADRRIELRLGRAAFQRHGEALDDLAGVGADHVTADDAVARRVDNQLHHRHFVATTERMLQRLERRSIDVDAAELMTGLAFRQADGRRRRLTEDRGWYARMRRLHRAPMEKRLGQRLAFRGRHGRQVESIGAVADGEDVRYRSTRVRVDRDGAVALEPNPDRLQAQVDGVRVAAGGVED